MSKENRAYGFSIGTPESCAADICNARAELVSGQIKYAEDRVGVSGRVGRYPGGLKLCLLLQHNGEQIEAIAQGAGNGHRVRPVNWLLAKSQPIAAFNTVR